MSISGMISLGSFFDHFGSCCDGEDCSGYEGEGMLMDSVVAEVEEEIEGFLIRRNLFGLSLKLFNFVFVSGRAQRQSGRVRGNRQGRY